MSDQGRTYLILWQIIRNKINGSLQNLVKQHVKFVELQVQKNFVKSSFFFACIQVF